jgi:two-component system, chemotaxis family, sensor kinase CheA
MIDTDIIEDYSNEARELLEEMDDSLIRLEREGQSPELLNNIFRAVHCIKGSAEYIGLERSSALTHGVENVLDRIREGVMPINARITDFLFRAKDVISRLVHEVSAYQQEKTEIVGLMEELEVFLRGTSGGVEPATPAEASAPGVPPRATSEIGTQCNPGSEASPHDRASPSTDTLDSSEYRSVGHEFSEEMSSTAFEQTIPLGGQTVVTGEEETFSTSVTEGTETLGEEPTTDHVARLEHTGSQILNVALYLDDLQDGMPPQEVVGPLAKSLEGLIGSLESLGLPDAVLLLEAMSSRIDAIDPEKESCSPECIAELRGYLEHLRSYYPEGFFPLEPTGEPRADRLPLPETAPAAQSFHHIPLYHELMKIPGLDYATVAAILKCGFTSSEQLAQADVATLVRIGALSPTLAREVKQAVGSAAGRETRRPRVREQSLLADVDDELLQEFEGLFAGAETADMKAAGESRTESLAADLLGELDALGEDADREILEIFLAYGREILDKLRQAAARIDPGNIQRNDLQTCADLIKSIRSSSNYMDFQRLATFLDEWYQKTVWAAEQGASLTPTDCRFMEESRARFEAFLTGLDAVLNRGAFPGRHEAAVGADVSVADKAYRSSSPDRERVRPARAPDEEIDHRAAQQSDIGAATTTDRVPTEPPVATLEVPTADKETIPTEELLSAPGGRPADMPVPRGVSPETAAVRTMRVDSAKVDVLLNQVGELVVNRSYVEQLSLELRNLHRQLQAVTHIGKKELVTVKNLSLKVGEASLALGRVANDIQEGVMKLRMLPIGQLFNRMPRLIRDLSRRVSKTVTLEVQGGDTEVDKRVIEQIYNPLVHLIRNAVDHGIEDAATRRRMGKKQEGTVVLSAYSQGNQVVIDIEDDGSGIDTQAVIEKAVETRLVDEGDAKNLGSQEIYNLLFTPGFSTSKRVTRTSGRGVGMDVVKRDVEKINGNVEISSETGAGTRVSIKIPLTLAIIQTLLIRVGKHVFAVPLTSVREILLISPSNISTIEGFEVLKFREETIPILRVHEVFNLKDYDRTREPRFLVLAAAGSKTVGLLVEELVGEQDVVIKPLADHVFESRGLAGSTILGDGAIALVLDVTEMIEDVIAGQRQQAAMMGRSHSAGSLMGLRNGFKA